MKNNGHCSIGKKRHVPKTCSTAYNSSRQCRSASFKFLICFLKGLILKFSYDVEFINFELHVYFSHIKAYSYRLIGLLLIFYKAIVTLRQFTAAVILAIVATGN